MTYKNLIIFFLGFFFMHVISASQNFGSFLTHIYFESFAPLQHSSYLILPVWLSECVGSFQVFIIIIINQFEVVFVGFHLQHHPLHGPYFTALLASPGTLTHTHSTTPQTYKANLQCSI